jgi:hypothetical protein
MVEAEGLDLDEAEEPGEARVVAELGVLVEGKVAGIEADVRIEEEFHALAHKALDSRGSLPEETVMDKEEIRPESGRPADGFQGGVYGEGDAHKGTSISIDLNSIEGCVDGGTGVDLEKRAAPGIEFAACHTNRKYSGREGDQLALVSVHTEASKGNREYYLKKRLPGEGGETPGKPDGNLAITIWESCRGVSASPQRSVPDLIRIALYSERVKGIFRNTNHTM